MIHVNHLRYSLPVTVTPKRTDSTDHPIKRMLGREMRQPVRYAVLQVLSWNGSREPLRNADHSAETVERLR